MPLLTFCKYMTKEGLFIIGTGLVDDADEEEQGAAGAEDSGEQSTTGSGSVSGVGRRGGGTTTASGYEKPFQTGIHPTLGTVLVFQQVFSSTL
jgi:hypothetical protein